MTDKIIRRGSRIKKGNFVMTAPSSPGRFAEARPGTQGGDGVIGTYLRSRNNLVANAQKRVFASRENSQAKLIHLTQTDMKTPGKLAPLNLASSIKNLKV